MKGAETPLSEADKAEALKEYQAFLAQFDIHNNQQADALIRLGHLIMAMEENEEEGIETGAKLPSRHHRAHFFST